MPKARALHLSRNRALVAAIAMAIPAAYAAPQETSSADSKGTPCADLGAYIFVGGTGGF